MIYDEISSKNLLQEILQKKGMPLDIYYTTSSDYGFISYLTIESVFDDRKFFGEHKTTKKDAEKSAAANFMNNGPARLELETYQSNADPVLTGDGPPKNQILEIFQAKGMLPSEAVFDCHSSTVSGGFQATLRIPRVFGDRTFVGEPRTTKKDAERSVALMFLNDWDAVGRLRRFDPKHSAVQSASAANPVAVTATPSAIPSSVFTTAPAASNSIQFTVTVEVSGAHGETPVTVSVPVAKQGTTVSPTAAVAAVTPKAASTSASAEVLIGPPKNHILEILQRRGYMPSDAIFSTRNVGMRFQGYLTIPLFFGDQVFSGPPCSNKKEAELQAAMAMINDAVAMHHLRTFNP